MDDPRSDYQAPIREGRFEIRFPAADGLTQDHEWCEVRLDGRWKRFRFHDYGEIYAVPGLYETLFSRILCCRSPRVVLGHLADLVRARGGAMGDLRAFDIGAGNGLVGEMLQHLGTRFVVGNDIFPEARQAVVRDRSWVYEDYRVFDLTRPPAEILQSLEAASFNTLTAVGALGFGDIPPKAFQTAYNLVADEGWIAFNIHERFLLDPQASGFAGLIRALVEGQVMRMEHYGRYQHRVSIAGTPLYYISVVATKHGDISDALVDAVSAAVTHR